MSALRIGELGVCMTILGGDNVYAEG